MNSNWDSSAWAKALWPGPAVLGTLSVLLPLWTGTARDLSEQEVRVAVQTWVRTVTADARPDAVVERMEPYLVEGQTTAYMVHLAGGGFCLAGADDLVLPVYLYSPRGTYRPGNPEMGVFLREIDRRTKHLKRLVTEKGSALTGMESRLQQRSRYWQSLLKEPQPTRDVAVRPSAIPQEPYSMELHLTSQWHQGEPFNDQTPAHPYTTPPNAHTLVGCNATAQSQIMYYWKWPPAGTGSASVDYVYRWRTTWDNTSAPDDPGIDTNLWAGRLAWNRVTGRLYMNGAWDASIFEDALKISERWSYQLALYTMWDRLNAGTNTYAVNLADTYNWELMSDSHPRSAAGDLEVAKLCGHVAISMESSFGLSATRSQFQNWKLHTAFCYDPDVTFYASNSHPTMIDLFTTEIRWLRPLALGGWGSLGGHAYVVYGYSKATDPDRQFLMNMGWDPASAHVWYTLDTTPFPDNQDLLINIAPASVVRFVGNTVAGDGSPSEPYRNIEQALQEAPDGSTLIFKGGSLNTFASTPLVINRPLTLRGYQAVIARQ